VDRPPSSPLKIGEVARRSGLTVDTVRFYEKQGLLGKVRRRAGGMRIYDPEVVRRLDFVRAAVGLGFSLAEIGGLLALRVSSRTSCETVRARAVAKLADVDARIGELTRMRTALASLADTCAHTATSTCPFLDALERTRPS
jgi:DNA-binding transcriptional MerR regulator